MPSKARIRLGQFLKEKRLEMGFSQGYVSRYLGYTTPQFVSNFERGLCSPPQHKIRELIELYKISPKALLVLMLDVEEENLMELIYDDYTSKNRFGRMKRHK